MKQLIRKKSNREKLSQQELKYFVDGYVKGEIPDDQAAALLTSMNINDLDEEETKDLTEAMLKSGKIWNLSGVEKIILDKHSCGGVGDKVTIVLIPLIASLGGYIGKSSGRAIAYLGGTIDKLESIPGINLYLSHDDYISCIKNTGLCLVGTTDEISPADKKILRLRDSVNAFGSIGLVVSSVMSKKLATNSDCVVIEMTCGNGGFCQKKEQAKEAARLMILIGKEFKKDIRCVITNMDQPLGYAVGNILEVQEAMNALKGKIPKDLEEVVLALGSIMLVQGKICKTKEEAKEKIIENLHNGKAYEKFKEWIQAQGGDISYLEESKFPKSLNIVEVKSEKEGYIKNIFAMNIGDVSMSLGAGKENLTSEIDYSAGIVLNKKVGDFCREGEVLCQLYTNKDEQVIKKAIIDVKNSYVFSKEKVEYESPVLELIEN